jgi:hypothetical protein
VSDSPLYYEEAAQKEKKSVGKANGNDVSQNNDDDGKDGFGFGGFAGGPKFPGFASGFMKDFDFDFNRIGELA